MPITEPTATAAGVRLTGNLPKPVSHNGFAAIADDLIANPRQLRTAIVVFHVQRIIEDVESGEYTPVVQLVRVEPLGGKADAAGRKLLATAATERTGDTLPIAEFDQWATVAGGDDE